MAKIIKAGLKGVTPAQRSRVTKQGSVTTRKVIDAAGKAVTVHIVDPDSSTLADDLSYVFKQNVARARKEQKRLFGSADRVAKK